MDTQNIDAFAALQARITQLEKALNNPAPAPATRAEPTIVN
jgi:BMFP domain-containing protein YqiC